MEYLRNTWYMAMWSQDLKPGQIEGRTYLGEQVVLFRSDDGTVAALSDICPHRFSPLHRGSLVKGSRIRCAYHGLEFDGSGACVHNPHGHGKIPSAARVRTFPICEKHSIIWIWMGEDEADPAAIRDFSLIDEKSGNDVSRRDGLRMAAGYELVVDNLMDLSHTTFVHGGLLGNAEMLKSEIKIRQDGHDVCVERFARNVPVTQFFDLQFMRDGGPVDLWMNITWLAPALLINDNGVTHPGRPPSEGTGVYGMHFLTPETATTCWYHFTAVRQNPIYRGEPIDSEVREQIATMRRYAFAEQDQPVIAAQQQTILRAGRSMKPVSLETDAGIERYKRVLGALIAAENASVTPAQVVRTPVASAVSATAISLVSGDQ